MDDFVLVDDLGPFKTPPASTSHYDDMFDSYFNSSSDPPGPSPSSSAPSPPPPVFDKPVFDDDPDAVNPFGAIPLFGDGTGAAGGGGEGEDYLDGLGTGAEPGMREPEVAGFDDDLIPGAVSSRPTASAGETEAAGFADDVIPGLGESTSLHNSTREEQRIIQEKETISSRKTSVSMPEDPFVILGATSNSGYSSFGLFTDHLDNMGMPPKLESTNFDGPSTTSGMFDSSDIFGGVPKPMPTFLSASEKERNFCETSMSHSNQVPKDKPVQQASSEAFGSILPETRFTGSSDIHEASGITGFHTSDPLCRNMRDMSPERQCSKMSDDVWLTVSDVVLVTQPTSAPPPSRPPPPLAAKQLPAQHNNSKSYPRHQNQRYHPSIGSVNTPKTSQFDELEDFVMAKPNKFANGRPQVINHRATVQDSSTAAAGFMDRAEVRPSEGVNQGDLDSMFNGSQFQQEIDDKGEFYAYDRENRDEEEKLEHDRKQREHEEEQIIVEREREEELEREREMARRKEQEDQKRREKEKEGRQAVERAVREARERAAAEARIQAERVARQRSERAAVQKAAAEARERAAIEARERAAKATAEAKERAAEDAAERAAKVAAEAREKAAVEARERMAKAAAELREREAVETRERAARAATEAREKAAAEARAERAAVEKVAAEARRRAERSAVERATAEARQRAANEARQRAANEARQRAAAEAQARENQQRTAQPDLDSFFGMPSKSSTAPRPQAASTNPFDVQPQSAADLGAVRTSSGSVSTFMQSPSTNLMDDLSSIFGAPSSSAVFKEVNGETEERRKARLERHQRTMERAAKALAEKNERDLQVQREQEERHRISETLDFEIKRWAAGKEGNLRALLSTLQYVLWPECGWRPIPLTDLITAASVKKEYRKATLCIHPDKVQQKGANLQQKYIAEKVFDLLKEAWNKFNSEEFF